MRTVVAAASSPRVVAASVPYAAVWTLALDLERSGFATRVNPPGGGFYRVGKAAPALLVHVPPPRVETLRALVDTWSPSVDAAALRRSAATAQRLGVDYYLLVAAPDQRALRQRVATFQRKPVILVYTEDDEGRIAFGNGHLKEFVPGARAVAKNKRASAGATARARFFQKRGEVRSRK